MTKAVIIAANNLPTIPNNLLVKKLSSKETIYIKDNDKTTLDWIIPQLQKLKLKKIIVVYGKKKPAINNKYSNIN